MGDLAMSSAPAALQLSVVCPVYNEGANIKKLLERLERDIRIPMELIVVYDRDDDDTLPVLAKLLPPFPVRTVRNHFGRGALNAIKSGFREARCEATLVVMADLSDDLSVVPRMHELIHQGRIRDRHGGGGQGVRVRGTDRGGPEHLDGSRQRRIAIPPLEMVAQLSTVVLLRFPRSAFPLSRSTGGTRKDWRPAIP